MSPRPASMGAKVIKNEDDDGWAVEIRKQGSPSPFGLASALRVTEA
ncbi:hypothetical protein [Corallococcus terminator]|nr:hypothetical protein [Corallococcus terminator]